MSLVQLRRTRRPARDPVGTEVRPFLAFVQELFGEIRPREFAVRFWDGTTWGPDAGRTARFTLVIRSPGALRRIFWPPRPLAVGFGEAYIFDDIDIEGDLEAACGIGEALHERRGGWNLGRRVRLGKKLLGLANEARRAARREVQADGARHTRSSDRKAIAYHYNLSNDFYKLWLDERLVYSCAYFADNVEDLDAAQVSKLDHVCRKLRLQPGERLLDLGCGWGGLLIHAAQHYGVEAVGLTLSRAQADFATARIAELGLSRTCRIEFRDYRDISASEPFDKISSVGMVEHIGEANLATAFRHIWNLLRPGGLFLLHGITRRAGEGRDGAGAFVNKYVFPNGELSAISTILSAAEDARFEVRDVESLREHYALTCRHWVRRLEQNHAPARRYIDEVDYRIWRLYMAGSAYQFAAGGLNLHQSLLSRPDRGRTFLPMTRADLYAAPGCGPGPKSQNHEERV